MPDSPHADAGEQRDAAAALGMARAAARQPRRTPEAFDQPHIIAEHG